MVQIVEFVATWNGNTKKGSIVMRRTSGEADTLSQLSMQRFAMFVTMLQGSPEIFFDPDTKSLRTGVCNVG